jgi:hypothetical protein
MSADLLAPPSNRLYSLAARAAVRADAMGLLPEGGAGAPGVPEQSTAALRRILHTARGAGIGRALTPPGNAGDVARWEGFATDLLDALEASPLPQHEWAGLERVLGAELLAALVGVSPSSLRRYATGARATPDDVAARLHFLALVVGDLAGSYNAIGVRRWFGRPRTQLGGEAPAARLRGEWDPQDEGPARVRDLAAALLGAPAT